MTLSETHYQSRPDSKKRLFVRLNVKPDENLGNDQKKRSLPKFEMIFAGISGVHQRKHKRN